jgi:hypothetical protein
MSTTDEPQCSSAPHRSISLHLACFRHAHHIHFQRQGTESQTAQACYFVMIAIVALLIYLVVSLVRPSPTPTSSLDGDARQTHLQDASFRSIGEQSEHTGMLLTLLRPRAGINHPAARERHHQLDEGISLDIVVVALNPTLVSSAFQMNA